MANIETIDDFVFAYFNGNQTNLVNEALEKDLISIDDVIDRNEDEDVLEWHLINDDYILKLLQNKDETTIESNLGTWWGRTTSGQMISMDTVIEDIYEEIKKK